VSVAPGASVTWQITGGTHNVTFGAIKPTGGDVPDTNAGRSVSRTFPVAGTFDYQCARHSGMTGRVVVGDAAAPGAPSEPSAGVVVQATATVYTAERIEITSGSVVTWDIAAGAGGVVFDEEAPEGGNIPASTSAQRVSRTFSTEGDYDYHNSRNADVKGRVRVR
jgi:plastocyanin